MGRAVLSNRANRMYPNGPAHMHGVCRSQQWRDSRVAELQVKSSVMSVAVALAVGGWMPPTTPFFFSFFCRRVGGGPIFFINYKKKKKNFDDQSAFYVDKFWVTKMKGKLILFNFDVPLTISVILDDT